MSVDEAYDFIATAIDAGRLANGYLLSGNVAGEAMELTTKLLMKLYPDASEQIEKQIHPDVHIVEPEGRARMIKIESIREKLIEPMSVTSYSGGWKTGVIVSADRLNETSANAILKMLEEPPPQTLFVLTSDQSDKIMPTIVSRCQRIDLVSIETESADEVMEAARTIVREAGEGVYARAQAAAELTRLWGELKDGVDDFEVVMIRDDFYRALLAEMRQWMVGEKLPRYQAFRNIEAVEEAYQQSCKSISDEPVLAMLMDRLFIPGK